MSEENKGTFIEHNKAVNELADKIVALIQTELPDSYHGDIATGWHRPSRVGRNKTIRGA